MQKILIIEDDPTIIEGLEAAFKFHGFQVSYAESSETGLPLVRQNKPDLVILDIMLPGLDGFETCKRIREQDQHIPIIMLTAKSQESDKLLGFELGADDYVTKPFSAKELIARVKAVLKRTTAGPSAQQVVTIGNATVNFDNFTLCKGGDEFALSPKEHAILKLFVNQPDTVISRSRIIDEVWGDEYFPSPKTIDNFVVKLRGKIEDNPKKPRHILTVHGAGYKFKF
ncbi:MAG: response regulator transcription factor [Candidatus Aminicenantes bacterium]|nr:MAG: response regulator transcription factor [Candidatus Aminicenantes bacterium]